MKSTDYSILQNSSQPNYFLLCDSKIPYNNNYLNINTPIQSLSFWHILCILRVMSNKNKKLMKKLALLFTAVFLIGTSVSAKTTNTAIDNSYINGYSKGYGNSFIFTEGGIEFSVFPDGQFDFYAPNYGPKANISINTPNISFSFNTGYDYGPYVQYDDYGAIIQIENVPIYYDYYGRITQAGNVKIRYNHYGHVSRVGGL